LEPAALEAYAGTYQLLNGNNVDIKLKNKQLNLYYSPNNKYLLQAATETGFYSTAEFLNIKFSKGDNMNVTGLQLERYGNTQTAKKVK
jgi:hypothetical protein